MDYGDYEHILIEKRGNGIVLLTMNRPETFNSTNFRLHYELSRIWLNIAEDTDVRVAVITGATTSWAMRSPGAIRTGCAPRLITNT